MSSPPKTISRQKQLSHFFENFPKFTLKKQQSKKNCEIFSEWRGNFFPPSFVEAPHVNSDGERKGGRGEKNCAFAAEDIYVLSQCVYTYCTLYTVEETAKAQTEHT